MSRCVYSTIALLLAALPMTACDPVQDNERRGNGVHPSLPVEMGMTDSDEQACGEPTIQELTAGQNIDVGSITLGNDENNLIVTFETDTPWLLGTTHVHVGSDIDDVPESGGGQPIPGLFDYAHEREVPPGVTVDTHTIPFSDLNLSEGQCGVELYIWMHAEVFVLGDNGEVIQSETAWGGDTPGEDTPGWLFLAHYEVPCCDDPGGQFRTQTQGGWGTACNGENPGCYRDAWFDTAFAGGLALGCEAGHTATFTSAAAVEAFLPAGGAPAPLGNDHLDPIGSTEAGVFLSQLLAASLSAGFDAADPDFSEAAGLLPDQILCNTGMACDGTSVAELLSEANAVIGGCDGTLTASELSDCLTAINENYVDGTTDNGLLCAP